MRYTFMSDGYAAVNNDVCYEDQNEDYCGDAIDKLAAYEDTGYSPIEIKSLEGEWSAMRKVVDSYRKVEEQGLLVRLPCKVEDKVYLQEYASISVIPAADVVKRPKSKTYDESQVAKIHCITMVPNYPGVMSFDERIEHAKEYAVGLFVRRLMEDGIITHSVEESNLGTRVCFTLEAIRKDGEGSA